MPLRKFTLLLLVMSAIFVAPTARALDLGGHDRDGVVIGLNMGYGWNHVNLMDGAGVNRNTGDLTTFSGDFRLGWARNDHLIGSLALSGWKHSFIQNIAPASATNLNFLAEVEFFPTGQGLWLKGGIGVGSLDFYVNTADPLNRILFKESGLTYALGAGYEFRVSDSTGFGINYDYTYVDLGDFAGITGAAVVNHVVGISLRWYQP